MSKLKIPNTYVIIFCVLAVCTMVTWIVPGAEPQSWQLFSALFKGFSQQSEIIAFVLIVGGAFWVVNSTRAVDVGITKFINRISGLERYAFVRKLGIGNMVIVMVMLLFGLFGAVFGMSEETIAFVAVVLPLARSLGYDEKVAVLMVYVAAHVGFAGAMLNPFTIGIAQDMAGLPLFSGIEYRTFCWLLLMIVAIIFALRYASRHKGVQLYVETEARQAPEEKKSGVATWLCFGLITVALLIFCIMHAASCEISLGQKSYQAPWLLWAASALFVVFSIPAIRSSAQMFIMNLLIFTVVFMVIGVMGYGWYLPQICSLFMALALAAGVANSDSADTIAREFVAGAKDIFSAALIIGFAAGIIVILQDGKVIDTMLGSLASALEGSGRLGALSSMYGLQAFINVFIPSASAKAAVTMPIMAPFSDLIGLSRQATVLAFQFGDGFTNMITPCSGVLMAVLSVAKIPYAEWFRFIWKFILVLIVLGFLMLVPAVFMPLSGF